jgi:hypothetical protein
MDVVAETAIVMLDRWEIVPETVPVPLVEPSG